MEQIVLLVDDDENLLHGLARALRQQPYRLNTARSAEEAVWTLKSHPIDLIVADERMPGMSGGDLLAWVARHYPEVMRIVVTGHATADAAIRAINEGSVYHFFTKPCDVVQLAVTIRKALEHKKVLNENRRLTYASSAAAPCAAARAVESMVAELKRADRILSGELQEALALASVLPCPPDPQFAALIQAAAEAAAQVRCAVQELLVRNCPLPQCPAPAGATEAKRPVHEKAPTETAAHSMDP